MAWSYSGEILQYSGQEPLIRVGLADDKQECAISADVPFVVMDVNKKQIASFGASEKLVFKCAKEKIFCNGKQCPDIIVVRTCVDDEKTALVFNGRKYRGNFEVFFSTAKKDSLTLNNVLPVEKYLYSVIGAEVSPSWPMECLKAQSIAARSYALFSLSGKKYSRYDVLPDTSDQTYLGKETEYSSTRKAVDATRGIVATYNNKIAQTLFMGGGGGRTAAAIEVWGTNQPYLQSVRDFDEQSPNYSWTVRFKSSDFSSRLLAAGYKCGKVQEILLSALGSPEKTNYDGDRTASGRVALVVVIGDKETVEITGIDMRKIFGLKSTLFGIKADKDEYVFCGRGWGHGIGMSQWGAKRMADGRDKGGFQADYQQILKYYFKGIELRKIY